MKKIVFTGGGTAGHVMPILAIVDSLRNQGLDLYYMGSKNGIEKELAEKKGIPYYQVSTGKLRRYFDLENFIDPFRIIKGIFEARKALKKIKPNLVFSKGGFVSVPVVLAASWLKIPVLLHESDYSPGLANKLTLKFANRILVTFPETLKYLPQGKSKLTGTPIRKELLEGDYSKGLELTGFNGKPVVMIMGGSSGSETINKVVRDSLDDLVKNFNIIHLCGRGNKVQELNDKEGYKQFEFVTDELAHLFAITDLMVSRSGANTLYELLALKIPNILIPLSLSASRGDQILNAKSFKTEGFSVVLAEKDLSKETLVGEIESLYENREKYIKKMKETDLSSSNKIVLEEINRFL
jgi:UDP-N-acetylglucosamine--N-acetylmuramyl-(pentapeptide) pyrophosphoryl-undecaprenol N-acetylglucosamine transferase